MSASSSHLLEVAAGERFTFGANWRRFLAHVDENCIATAEQSLRDMLGVGSLAGKTFLDIGSGSGLFSLAARRLGARVHSFDYDPQSVACTRELKRRYFADDAGWTIEEGSVLDADFLRKLGHWDIVYSWGVLHHTGAMWQALENVAPLPAPGGKLFIALYNDGGFTSRFWLVVKKIYNRLPGFLKGLFAVAVFIPVEIRSFVKHLIRLDLGTYFATLFHYDKNRGMSWVRDKVDWIGGYPYEVSTTEQVIEFFEPKGYAIERVVAEGGGLACNEFVFARKPL